MENKANIEQMLSSELWSHRENIDYTQEVIRRMFGVVKNNRSIYLQHNMQAYDIYLRDRKIGLSDEAAYRHAMKLRRDLTNRNP